MVICVLAVGGAAAYFAYARSSAEAQIASAPAVAQTSDLAALLAAGSCRLPVRGAR